MKRLKFAECMQQLSQQKANLQPPKILAQATRNTSASSPRRPAKSPPIVSYQLPLLLPLLLLLLPLLVLLLPLCGSFYPNLHIVRFLT